MMKTRSKSSNSGSPGKKAGAKCPPKSKQGKPEKNVPDSYRTLTEYFRIGVYRTTPGPQGKFIEVNPALVKMLGYEDRAEILKLPVCHFYQNPQERTLFSQELSRQGVLHSEESTFRKKDGSPIVVSEIAVTVRDTKGDVIYFDGLVEDITERKQSEKQYDLQKTYLEKLFNAAPEAIALHNDLDRIVDINDEFTLIFGYTRDEAIGKQINDLVAPEELIREAADISQRVIRGERIELETKRKRKDGTLIDVSVLGAPIFHQGKQIGDYAIYRDITERKKAEEEIRIQKTYLESLLNSAPEAVVFHDMDDIIVSVNDEFLRMFGYSREQAIGKPVNSLVAPTELAAEAEGLSQNVVHGRRVEVETKRRRRDGTLFHVSILGAPIFHQGKQMGVYAIYRDISDRKNAEQEILIQKTFFERLFNSAPEAILLHDNDDRVLNVNEEFVRMFGYSRNDAIGRQVNDLVAPPEFLDEASRFSRMSFRGERVEAETKRKRKDGILIDVSILGAPVLHEGKQIAVYAIYRDITERKKEEEERIRAQEEARMARNIQMNFLPKSNPEIAGYDIAGKTVPAMNVGGDYYDFIRLDEHHLAIGIGDVSGNGLAASLVMANVQATIRGQALAGSDPAHCLQQANKLLYRSTDARTFVSIFYGILDTRNHSISFANAGQNLPILFSKEDPPVSLSSQGVALGLMENASYEVQTVTIRPGDTLLLFTDGIIEAMNAAMEDFGEERVKDLIVRNNASSASVIVETLFRATHDFVANGAPQDDMTAVLLKKTV